MGVLDFVAISLLLRAHPSCAAQVSNYTTVWINTAVCPSPLVNNFTSFTVSTSASSFGTSAASLTASSSVNSSAPFGNATIATSAANETASATAVIDNPAFFGISLGNTDEGCSNPNVQPSDLPTYGDITTPNGNTYFLINTNGYVLPGSSYPGYVFGPNGDQANSWAYCSSQCLDWCDSHDCLSFNIFTFQESDYEDCQITCECRPSPDYYTIYDSEYPSYTWTRHDPNDENCPVVNVTPSDLPTETEVESPAGTPYFMQDSSGRILSAQGSYSLGGVVFGSQPDPNSWDDCLQRCLSFCDADPNCKSFNIFTFEESDYANCQVTCECRAATRFYDASDYSQTWDPKFASKIWSSENPDAYYFTPDCKFDPSAAVFDPCLWEAADIPGWIRAMKFPELRHKSTDWVSDAFYNSTHFEYACSVSEILGCPVAFLVPQAPFNVNEIRGFLAAVAGRRYVLTLAGQYYYLKNAFVTVLDDISDLINYFTGNGAKAPATDDWDYVSDGLTIIASALTIVAAVVAPEVAVPLEVLSGVLGVTGGIGGVIDAAAQKSNVPPLGKDITGLKDYMKLQGDAFLDLISNTSIDFLTNHVNAATILDATSSNQWLDTTIEPIWTRAELGVDATAAMLKAWATARIFQSLGIFIHMENGCDHESMTMHLYNSQGCIAWSDNEISFPLSYLFPVYYIRESSWHDTRDYGLADNLVPGNFDNNPNFNWGDVAIGSMKCQYHYKTQTPFSGGTPYPTFDTGALLNVVVNYGGSGQPAPFDPRTVPCLWNLPVCYSADSNILGGCVDDQGCCTGHGGCDRCSSSWYDDDNSGLDDWCAGKLGISNHGSKTFRSQC